MAACRDVNALHIAGQALGVPMKRFEPPMLGFLSREETASRRLRAPDSLLEFLKGL